MTSRRSCIKAVCVLVVAGIWLCVPHNDGECALLAAEATASGPAAGSNRLTSRPASQPAPSPAPVGRICRIRLTSDVEPDMSSMESILNGAVRPGMTDEEKCLALFWVVHDHRFWYSTFYPTMNGQPVYDPILMLNCYPATICQQDAAYTSALWAAAGFDVRYWQLGGHTSGEVYYGGKWRNFDATSGRYVRGADGGVGGVDLSQRFFKPESFIEPFSDFSIAHQMNLSLRKGETFLRRWGPMGDDADYWLPSHHPTMRADDRGAHRLGLNAAIGRKPYLFDTQGVGVANGLWTFRPDMREVGWQDLFEKVDNVAAGADGVATVASPSKPAELVWRIYSPYTITGAFLEGDFTVPASGRIKAAVSADNGASWNDVGEISGGPNRIALRKYVADGFGYMVKLSMQGPAGTGVKGLGTSTIVQINPLSLPAIKNGRTTIRLAAGEQLETITVLPNLETPDYRTQVTEETNVVIARELSDKSWYRGLRAVEPDKESVVVFKVTTPGDVRQVRWGGRLHTAEGDLNEMYYSTDGKTWKQQKMTDRWLKDGGLAAQTYRPFNETTTDWLAGTKTVYLKYRFRRTGRNLALATNMRMDVDYVPPGAMGALPVEITYCWDEADSKGDMVEKINTEIVRTLPFTYSISVGGKQKPLMKWVRMRLYDGREAPPYRPTTTRPAATTRPATTGPTGGHSSDRLQADPSGADGNAP